MITVVPGAGDSVTAVDTLQQALAETPGVATVTPAFPNRPATPDAYLFNLVPTTAPQDAATSELVTTLRDEVIPAVIAGTSLDVKVTGTTAANIDFTDFLAQRTFVFFAAVLALSFLLLMMVFRSLLVPLKAVVMNVLSIAATYGVLVVIFQWGWGADLIGIDKGPIEVMLPLMLFAIVFGLSMDYEVFPPSRVRAPERQDRRLRHRRRRRPRQKTARVITAEQYDESKHVLLAFHRCRVVLDPIGEKTWPWACVSSDRSFSGRGPPPPPPPPWPPPPPGRGAYPEVLITTARATSAGASTSLHEVPPHVAGGLIHPLAAGSLAAGALALGLPTVAAAAGVLAEQTFQSGLHHGGVVPL